MRVLVVLAQIDVLACVCVNKSLLFMCAEKHIVVSHTCRNYALWFSAPKGGGQKI